MSLLIFVPRYTEHSKPYPMGRLEFTTILCADVDLSGIYSFQFSYINSKTYALPSVTCGCKGHHRGWNRLDLLETVTSVLSNWQSCYSLESVFIWDFTCPDKLYPGHIHKGTFVRPDCPSLALINSTPVTSTRSPSFALIVLQRAEHANEDECSFWNHLFNMTPCFKWGIA